MTRTQLALALLATASLFGCSASGPEDGGQPDESKLTANTEIADGSGCLSKGPVADASRKVSVHIRYTMPAQRNLSTPYFWATVSRYDADTGALVGRDVFPAVKEDGAVKLHRSATSFNIYSEPVMIVSAGDTKLHRSGNADATFAPWLTTEGFAVTCDENKNGPSLKLATRIKLGATNVVPERFGAAPKLRRGDQSPYTGCTGTKQTISKQIFRLSFEVRKNSPLVDSAVAMGRLYDPETGFTGDPLFSESYGGSSTVMQLASYEDNFAQLMLVSEGGQNVTVFDAHPQKSDEPRLEGLYGGKHPVECDFDFVL